MFCLQKSLNIRWLSSTDDFCRKAYTTYERILFVSVWVKDFWKIINFSISTLNQLNEVLNVKEKNKKVQLSNREVLSRRQQSKKRSYQLEYQNLVARHEFSFVSNFLGTFFMILIKLSWRLFMIVVRPCKYLLQWLIAPLDRE